MVSVKAKAAQKILSYLRKNPSASDTLEGITKWWLLNEHPVHEVQEALSELMAVGLIVERRGQNSHIYYRKSDNAG